jgi:hypothetical protein
MVCYASVGAQNTKYERHRHDCPTQTYIQLIKFSLNDKLLDQNIEIESGVKVIPCAQITELY